MSDLHAYVGLAQLININKVIKKKTEINNLYKSEINKINGLKILSSPNKCKSNHWLNILVVDKKKYGLSKNQIIKRFATRSIETRSLWFPNHLQKPFKLYESFDVKNSSKMFNSCLCLPSSYSLKRKEQKKIIHFLNKKFKN